MYCTVDDSTVTSWIEKQANRDKAAAVLLLLLFLAQGRIQYLECLDSWNGSFMGDFLRWILSTPRDLGGGDFGKKGTWFVFWPGTARESLPPLKKQQHTYKQLNLRERGT